jgi:hypothetical protein
MTLQRANTLSQRFKWIGLAVLTVATAANLTGFKLFFMPLAVIAFLCMMRCWYHDGWVTGYKAARKIYLHDSASDLERS